MKTIPENEPKEAVLITGKVPTVLINLTLPAIAGVMGMVIFNLVDTYFVGQLGTTQLAALSFTFPVVLIINSLALGIGVGTSALISRAVGEGDQRKVRRLATDSLSLALVLVLLFVISGLLTIDPLFTLLGAKEDTLPYIKEYMGIWYYGMFFVLVPMIGNNAIRALGDTKTPGLIMILSATLNIILDRLLIFGVGPFPQLGIAGAAIATVCARALTFVVAIYVLIFREKIVSIERAPFWQIWESWKSIIFIGLPNAVTRMTIPIAQGVFTSMIAVYGAPTVAGYGVATRVEFFALASIRALAAVIGPFVGQNLGAKRLDRVKLGISYAELFAIGFSLFLFAVFTLFARPIAAIFNRNPEVITNAALYLHIVPIGYGLQGVLLLATSILNVLHKPLHASTLSIIQMFCLGVPLALLLSHFLGRTGIYLALTVSFVLAGVLSHFLVQRELAHEYETA